MAAVVYVHTEHNMHPQQPPRGRVAAPQSQDTRERHLHTHARTNRKTTVGHLRAPPAAPAIRAQHNSAPGRSGSREHTCLQRATNHTHHASTHTHTQAIYMTGARWGLPRLKVRRCIDLRADARGPALRGMRRLRGCCCCSCAGSGAAPLTASGGHHMPPTRSSAGGIISCTSGLGLLPC